MLSLTIKDTKNFMSQLLIKEAFDGLFLSEAVIKTANSYTISGELNKDFFSEEEWNELPEKSYSRWSSVKPFCFQLIKGSKVPSYMKMVFLLPPEQVTKLLSDNQTALTPDDINGLFLNIRTVPFPSLPARLSKFFHLIKPLNTALMPLQRTFYFPMAWTLKKSEPASS